MSGGIWAPYKELASVVNQAILKKQPDAFYSLEAILKKHKTDFISLLKNPAKNSSHRSQVKKAVKDGLQIPSLPSIHTLPQDFIDEALILSDILDLNEISSVELLLAGEQQLPRFPTLTRGLVAILLYYDGRCSMVASLRTLIQAREGVSWSLGLTQATVNFVTSFTDELFADGLVKKILDLINSISVKEELEKLAKGRAIGDAKHRQQIIDYINEQRSCLADCLLHWACQNPFPKDETLLLYCHLQKMKVEPVPEEGGAKSAGGVGSKVVGKAGAVGGAKEELRLDAVGVALFSTLLACFNIGDATAENTVDVSLVDEDRYPLVTDMTFVPTMHAEILKGPGQWATPTLHAAVEFAWGILLRDCAGRAVFTESGMSELEDDDALVDDAVKMGAMHFIRQSVVASQHFHQEELCVQRIHWLVTSFIVNMPLKVNELRNQGDEIAREMAILGGDRESTTRERRGFEEFMKLIGDLYSSDPNSLQLALEYWSPAADQALQYQHGPATPGLSYRTPQRQLSLYKFITSCSDLLPAQLFSPFMHMLIGLSSSPATAHCCFNFLKANSPSLGGGGASAAISLDHFFHSLKQYYYSLSRDSAHKATPTGCAITPQELEGLKNVLRIIQTIAKHDETARVVMYENQSWLPVASLFGLVGCPVPRDLKAEILLTLAAFALSPEIASNMWVTLEVSQILNTVHSPLTGIEGDPSHHTPHQHSFALREGSIQVELEEIESQAEEYPLTRAFLSLLSALLDVPPPPTLGAGHRIPGFEPYLVFVRDAVFLKFDCRAYQNQEEKWEVATLALDVLHKLLSSHEFTEDDFQDSTYQLPNREVAIVPKSAGYSLLVHLMNNSQVLRKLLSLLDEACRSLSDASQSFSDPVARAALLSLKILESTLEREQEFFELLRRYNTKNVIINPLHQLLLGINPRTGKADHMVTIAKYVCVGNSLPELALTSVQILYWVTLSHKAGRDVVTTIVSDKDASAEILGGFVEHLEAEVDTSDSQDNDALDTVASVNRAVQVSILKLIASCINKSSPNLAHYLLGFEVATGKPISQTTLQDPGILGSPRTCLHSILSLVEHGQDARNPIGCHYGNTKVAEFCYKVLYLMCASRDLSTPTLRYLRNNHEYFFSQLVHLPLNPDLLRRMSDDGDDEGGDAMVATTTTFDLKQLSLMHQQAWVLKSVAIELRMTSLSHQRSHTQRIVNLLLSGPSGDITDTSSSGNGVGVTVGGAGGGARLKSDFDFLQEGRRKVLVLLDQVDFADKAVPALEQLESPHVAAIEQMVQSCETKDPISEQLLTDEKRLLKLLNNTEISASDVRRLLSYVESRNHINSHLNANYELFESWRQLVEVMLHCLVHSDMKKELKIAVLFELIQDLLLKVAHVEPTQLTTSVQGVVLILLSHLRQTVNSADPEQDDSALSSLYSGPLHGIMQGLIDNILKVPAAMQQAKAYLYGSLLYYLTMTKQEVTGGQRGKGVSLWQPDSDQNNIASGNLSTLNSFGETFMDTICKNACSGHDVARMLSLSLLDSIISLDWQGSWLRFMSQRGFLQTLCASIQWEDEGLQKMLLPAPEALKALYIYESKMAFLTRVVSNPIGARDIVSLNALSYIAQCSFIEMRPSYYGDSMGGGHMTTPFIPTSFDRYRQLFLPLLKFLIALLTCPGAHHKEACVQVASFIALHSEVFAAVLKEPLHASMDTMSTLQELSLVTAVISHSGIGQDLSTTSAQAVTALGAALHRLQRLMMSLLPHFWSKHNWHMLAQKAVNVDESDNSGASGASSANMDDAFLLIQQITANIVSYCQVAMTLGGTELSSPYCCILLTPDLSEALSMPKSKEPFLRRDLSTGTNAPSLGLLIQHLKECTEGYFAALEAHQQHTKKLESGGKLSSDEMRQLLDGVGNEKLLPSQQQSLARKRLQQLIANRKTEMQLYSYIIENMLYILWRHLQYYLVHCKPVDPDISLGVPGIDRAGPRRLQDSTSYSGNTTFELSSLGDGVRTSDLEDLKANAIKCLTDGFFKKLLDLEEAQLQSKAEMRVGFVQALVRRIRRLLKLRAATF